MFFNFNVSGTEPILKFDLSGSNNWSPYYFDDKDRPGILGELVPEVLALADIKGQHITLPAARLVAAIEKGDIDFDLISPAWFANQEFAPKFVLSEPLVPIKEYVVQLSANNIPITKEQELHNKPIGTVRGYYYHNDDVFIRQDFSSEKELIKALASKRIDYAIIGDLPAKYWSSRLDVKVKLTLLHSDGFLHIRLRNEHALLLNRLNSAIYQLHETGKVRAVINKYLELL
ncbi:substrate-binding periplasmic protein [Thalassotalea algicola]|nr:transporter substrate-binding domain-containing protein [Thalassotalea algicola]